jgi:squalene-hopene/tetraprenyl-beta-curcumene cyclase
MPSIQASFVQFTQEYMLQVEQVDSRLRTIREKIGRCLAVPIESCINYYYFYPYLFASSYPTLPETTLQAVAVAGVLYLDHLCILDTLVDNPERNSCHQLLLGAALHEEAIAVLRQIFASEAEFWGELSQLSLLHSSASMREKHDHTWKLRRFSEGEFLEIAAGKAGVSKATHIALASLSGTTVNVDALSLSQDYFNAAVQCYDDVKDWREDLSAGCFTNLLTETLLHMGLSDEDVAKGGTSADAVAHQLYYGCEAERVLDQALDYCRRAVVPVEGISVSAWINLIDILAQKIDRLRHDLRQTRLQTILRSHGFLSPRPDALLQNGLNFLLEQRTQGFPEAAHSMEFFLDTENHTSHETQTASVFQRAIIADVLLDACDHGLYDRCGLGDAECKELLHLRLKHVRGGWSYFPELPNLPPDADDLGQVMQVLARSNCKKVDVVDDALQLLFSDYSCNADGAFETWIVDRNAKDAATQGMIKAIADLWGSGCDVEVIANLAYGLALYEYPTYRNQIEAAASYVERQQSHSGLWNPTWYATPYYGSFAALRLLHRIYPLSSTLAKASEHFVSAQHLDGGFGIQSSTPLETALSILCLHLLPIDASEKERMTPQALRYLELTVREDGTWNASPFIQMDVNRARRGRADYVPRWLYYKSRTISTGYVVKAMMMSLR